MSGKFRITTIVILIIALLCSSVSVFAAETKETANTVEYVGALSAKTLLYSTTTKANNTEYTLEPGKPIVIPVNVRNAGVLCTDVEILSDEENMSVEAYLNRNKPKFSYGHEESGPNDWAAYASSYLECFIDGEWELNMGNVVPSKTYYLTLILSDDEYAGDYVNVKVNPYVYSTENRVLPSGNTNKWVLGSAKNKSVIWHKVVPDRTGLMTITMEGKGSHRTTCYLAQINLYDKNKKVISPTKSGRYYGVKQGNVYYLKLTNFKLDDLYEKVYKIKYSMTSGTDRAIGKKANAKKLVRKANATKTIFTAKNGTSTDWYKFYVPQKRETKITVDTTKMSGNVTVTAYKGNSKINSIVVPSGRTLNCKINFGAKNKAVKGTYYVKVVKGAKASGRYSVRYVY